MQKLEVNAITENDMLKLIEEIDFENNILCASAAETRFSVTAESKAMLYIPLQRNTM